MKNNTHHPAISAGQRIMGEDSASSIPTADAEKELQVIMDYVKTKHRDKNSPTYCKNLRAKDWRELEIPIASAASGILGYIRLLEDKVEELKTVEYLPDGRMIIKLNNNEEA